MRASKLLLVTKAFITVILYSASSSPSLAQEWGFRVKPRGTLRVVDVYAPSVSAIFNYAEGLITLDKDNNLAPCLAEDYRWRDDRTIEFKLRTGVNFQNGERFNAEAVKVNWVEYKRMESPRPHRFRGYVIPDETRFEIIDEYTVRFTLPEPDGIAFLKFQLFLQVAPAFFAKYKFEEKNYGYFPLPGGWGTGPFELVEGSLRFGKPSDRLVLKAYERYWDPRFPKVKEVIFNNALMGDRKEAMKLCRETEGAVDIVNFMRPLDTLKVAESPFAKIVKSRDVSTLVGVFNQRKKGSKWKDVRLRKAINYAINRQELWEFAAKGNAYNLGGFVPPGSYGHNAKLTLYIYDTVKARSLIAEAGYPNGFEVDIITLEAWKLEMQIIAKMLERIGLKVRLEAFTFPEFQSRYYLPALDKPPEQQDWDIATWIHNDWMGHTGVSFFTYEFLEESDYRWIAYDPTYEKMFKEITKIVDPQVQEEKIRQMGQYVYDHAYALFIYSPVSLYAVNKRVDFVPQKSTWLRLKETSVTDNHWSVRGKNN